MSSYKYRGYTVKNLGYYQPEHRVVWEATDENGEGCFHGFSMREVMSRIDEYEFEQEWKRKHNRNCDNWYFNTVEDAMEEYVKTHNVPVVVDWNWNHWNSFCRWLFEERSNV